MSSEPKESKSERLPFEPTQSRKKPAKSANSPAVEKGSKQSPKKSSGRKLSSTEARPAANSTVDQPKTSSSKVGKARRSTKEQLAIPNVVSNRMARRMALFCGIPTALGMLTFVISYLIVTKGLFNLPTVAVVLVSMGFFGLGVIGLSYGILSASWDEERVGTRLGFEEFSINFGRLTSAWKSAKQKKTISD